jgi:peptide/nickel transport system permease protein
VKTSTIQALDAPFVQTALAHGIPRQRILWRHVFPAAANPMISLFGFSIGALLSASLLIEVIMSWPGLGPLVLEAILARDLYLVIGVVMLSTAFLLAGNLLADLMLYAADPRIRKGKA